MKTNLCLLLVLLVIKATGQQNIDSLIQAERNFAAYASAHNTKQAFLAFMDSAAIEVEDGKPVKGLELWSKRKENNDVLKWHPQYAEISKANDLGYTTGPWTFQRTPQDSIAARGQYTTVWKLNEQGGWKFLVDMGTNYSLINNAKEVMEINAGSSLHGELAFLLSAEAAFSEAAASAIHEAHKKFLSEHSIINRNGYLPATITKDQEKILKDFSQTVKLTALGHGLATSGDLGFVYGSMAASGKNTAYLHIWRHEKNGWKLALEVLQL